MLSGIRNTYEMSKAAVVIQNLLEGQRRFGVFDADPAQVANKLVANVWQSQPDAFNGVRGPRPHKLCVAAIALAQGTRDYAESRTLALAIFTALGTVLNEFNINRGTHKLSVLDVSLLELAAREFDSFSDTIQDFTRPPPVNSPAEGQHQQERNVGHPPASNATEGIRSQSDDLRRRIDNARQGSRR